ncbi:MAG TPA: MmcQ/YjbR family DNA-binding protein [Rhizomicrobium sp.]|nr:MmcQ/YjbR family DNA-binding protein [Rhizomicrobium sp.]
MKYAEIEKFCLSLKGATRSVQWGDHHVFKVGDKMFAVLGDQGAKPQTMSFKTGDDSFDILTKAKNIIPAPYMARAKWVMLEKLDALNPKELKAYLTRAHALVASGLTKKKRAALGIEV